MPALGSTGSIRRTPPESERLANQLYTMLYGSQAPETPPVGKALAAVAAATKGLTLDPIAQGAGAVAQAAADFTKSPAYALMTTALGGGGHGNNAEVLPARSLLYHWANTPKAQMRMANKQPSSWFSSTRTTVNNALQRVAKDIQQYPDQANSIMHTAALNNNVEPPLPSESPAKFLERLKVGLYKDMKGYTDFTGYTYFADNPWNALSAAQYRNWLHTVKTTRPINVLGASTLEDQAALRELANTVGSRDLEIAGEIGEPPSWGRVENPRVRSFLRQQGYQGVKVRDEAGVSTALLPEVAAKSTAVLNVAPRMNPWSTNAAEHLGGLQAAAPPYRADIANLRARVLYHRMLRHLYGEAP